MLLKIKVDSAGYEGRNEAVITLNNELVKVNPNVNGHLRGLHLVVINSANGKIKTAQVFDTYKSSEELESFIRCEIIHGSILVAACQDECSGSLSEISKSWF